MMRNVPDAKKIQTILELIRALDCCILKVVEQDGLLTVYANVCSGEVAEDGILDDEYEDSEEDIDDEDYEEEQDEEELDEDEDYADYADCYQTCEEYKPVSEENWRCINYCPRCDSCLNPAI